MSAARRTGSCSELLVVERALRPAPPSERTAVVLAEGGRRGRSMGVARVPEAGEDTVLGGDKEGADRGLDEGVGPGPVIGRRGAS